MSDNRAQQWLDDATAERLLRGDDDDPRAEPLKRLLSAAAAPASVDAGREEMAVAAFRAARDEGLSAETEPRRIIDHWRRGRAWRTGRGVRVLAGALVATAAIGGTAVATATGALPGMFGPVGGRPPAGPSPTAQPAHPGAGPSDRPDLDSAAGDATRGVPAPSGSPTRTAEVRSQSLCRSWVVAVGRGQATDARAYERLVSEAGGRGAVPGYCASLLGSAKGVPSGGATDQGGGGGSGRDSGRSSSSSSDGKTSGGDQGDNGDDASEGKGGTDRARTANGDEYRRGHEPQRERHRERRRDQQRGHGEREPGQEHRHGRGARTGADRVGAGGSGTERGAWERRGTDRGAGAGNAATRGALDRRGTERGAGKPGRADEE